MVGELTETVVRTIQDAANRLTGAERRKFEAQVARDFCQGRRSELLPKWSATILPVGAESA